MRRHPSFVIGPKGEGGVLIFIDFADTSLKGDAFKFVEKAIQHEPTCS